MQAHYANLTPEERWVKISAIINRNLQRLQLNEEGSQSLEGKQTEKTYYSLPETAKVLNVSYRTVQRWVSSGRIIPIRLVKGRYLFDADQIDILKNLRHFKKYPIPPERKKRCESAAVKRPALSNTGIIRKKVHGKNKCEVFSLLCPNDKKHLGEVPLDYFGASYKNRPHGPVFIHCTKCDRTIRFQKIYSNHYKFHKEE